MNKIFNPTKETWSDILKRPTSDNDAIEETVNEIFNEVKTKGDKAIFRYTNLFDSVQLNKLAITEKEMEESLVLISDELKVAIKLAKSNIEKFHKAQKTGNINVETTKGVDVGKKNDQFKKLPVHSRWPRADS